MQNKRAVGTFHLTRNGFGYVSYTLNGEERTIPVISKFQDGVFDGDTVTVILPQDQDVKNARRVPYGKIFNLLGRARQEVIGVVNFIDGKPYIMPDEYFPCRIPVKNEPRSGFELTEGDKVAAEICKFKAVSAIRLRPFYSFGPADRLDTSFRSLFYKTPFNEPYSPEAIDQMRHILRADQQATPQRTDLSGKLIFTISDGISGNNSIGFSIRRNGDGYSLGLHISDVAEFITPGSPLDIEAAARGMSFNTGSKNYSMLPSDLSDDAFSFIGGTCRLAVSVFIEFSKDGGVLNTRFEETTVRSSANITFRDIDALVNSGDSSATLALRERFSSVLEQIYDLYALAGALRSARLSRGGVDLDSAHLVFDTDSKGSLVTMDVKNSSDACLMVKELFVAAGQAAGAKLREENRPCIYCGKKEKLYPSYIDMPTGLLPVSVRFGVDKPGYVSKTADYARASGKERLFFTYLHFAEESCNYSIRPTDHFVYRTDTFTRLSRPSRRYADLIALRAIKAYIHGEDISLSDSVAAANASLKLADRVEKESELYNACEYIRSHPALLHNVTVVSYTPDGPLVAADCGILGYLELPETTGTAIPAVGSKCAVRVKSVSFTSKKITFEL